MIKCIRLHILEDDLNPWFFYGSVLPCSIHVCVRSTKTCYFRISLTAELNSCMYISYTESCFMKLWSSSSFCSRKSQTREKLYRKPRLTASWAQRYENAPMFKYVLDTMGIPYSLTLSLVTLWHRTICPNIKLSIRLWDYWSIATICI